MTTTDDGAAGDDDPTTTTDAGGGVIATTAAEELAASSSISPADDAGNVVRGTDPTPPATTTTPLNPPMVATSASAVVVVSSSTSAPSSSSSSSSSSVVVRPPPPPTIAIALPPPPRRCCVVCTHPGVDLYVVGGTCKCAYHARCADLVGIRNRALSHHSSSSSSSSGRQQQRGGGGDGGDDEVDGGVRTTRCPNCGRDDVTGMEMTPLDVSILDDARVVGRSTTTTTTTTSTMGMPSSSSFGGVVDDPSSSSYPLMPHPSRSRCYDPSAPRTGRWTDEELSFRDAIITHFLAGSLPLCNGLRLNDFLGGMLKSKHSRLTKKMKNAKLSTNLYRIRSGHLRNDDAISFSKLECNFVNAISDPVERSEIVFHMRREWREHLAERLTYLRLAFDASEWLRSVDVVDRRVAMEATRSRMVKRRCLMGRAMEMDVGESAPGVFIDGESAPSGAFVLNRGGGGRDGRLASSNDVVDVKFGDGNDGPAGAGVVDGDCKVAASAAAADVYAMEDDGEFEGFIMSMLDETPSATTTSSQPVEAVYRHVLSPTHRPPPHLDRASSSSSSSTSTSTSTNFRCAAPFLAGVTSYMERHGVPFEHVDVWVPSSAPPVTAKERSAAPLVSSLGSGSAANPPDICGEGGAGQGRDRVGRLCFGGSATLGVQIVDPPPPSSSSSSSLIAPSGGGDDGAGVRKTTILPPERTIVPLTDDEAFNFSLFGDYSQMFSFSSGCGLPGRVFRSGVATWEQFLANAPPEMFERRGGAIQFGIRTALGLPIDSPNVGRIVLVLYSRHNRDKDEGLVARMAKDIRLLKPCPRWKLVVDVRNPDEGGNVAPLPVAAKPPSLHHPMRTNWPSSSQTQPALMGMDVDGEAGRSPSTSATFAATHFPDSDRSKRIINLIAVLQENLPSDLSSPLGVHLNSMMSLRMLLLGRNRSEEDEQLVETVLVLHESYSVAGRTSQDIAILVTRDYEFHTQHQQPIAARSPQPPPQSNNEQSGGRMANFMILQGPPQQQMMNNFNPTPSAPKPLGGKPWMPPAASA